MTNNIRRAAFAAVLSYAAATPAFAQTAQGNLSVSATVSKNCVVSASPMNFGSVDVTNGQSVDGTAELSIRCTSGTDWTATADAGLGSGATTATRLMQNGGSDVLGYTLYTDSARTNIWDDGEGEAANAIAGVGSGSGQLATIYGRVFSGQSGLPSGNYADTVQVTVTY
jgi:spore coat protein U-like protein